MKKVEVDRWLLPEGVEELLPPAAHKLESLRREVLDLYASWGYELVITPLIEYIDSLLVGSSHDLDLHTFKLTDQLSGRMMGVRADITPQVARIDAHCMNRKGPVRLCYSDSVLHTKPRGLLTSRIPIRIGAELFGHAGAGCDIELICLMHETLKTVGIDEIHIILGHVGIFRSLVSAAQLSDSDESELFDAVQRKAYEEIDSLLDSVVPEDDLRTMLYELSRLSGGESVLDEALEKFDQAPSTVKKELQELADIADGVRARLPAITIGFDLCELRGYQYHTGIVFAAYSPDYGRAIAKGGRYDDIGQVFGRARPASGFDSDLKTLARLSQREFSVQSGIFAPCSDDATLLELIARLRSEGEKVISDLSSAELSTEAIAALGCDRHLVQRSGEWSVEPL